MNWARGTGVASVPTDFALCPPDFGGKATVARMFVRRFIAINAAWSASTMWSASMSVGRVL